VAPSAVFTRYTLASGFATAVSQVMLVVLSGRTPAVAAGTIAFAAGAVPHFLLIRRWAAGSLSRQVTVYVIVTAVTGLLSIGTVTLADALVDPLVTNPSLHTVALNLAYLLGGAPVFVAKFLTLDRFLFVRRIGSGQLDECAGGETGGARSDVVVRLVSARRAGDVEVRPGNAAGELAEEQGGGDAARAGWALADIGDVAADRVG
jgi:putative flippase GtrA